MPTIVLMTHSNILKMMTLLFRNWLEAGYYEEDSMGELTRITDLNEIHQARKEERLYYHDGYSLNKELYLSIKNLGDDDTIWEE